MKLTFSSFVWIMCIGCVALLAGCATTPKVPIFLDPNLDHMQIDTITLLPVVDRRMDRSVSTTPEDLLGSRVKKAVEKLGYEVNTPGVFSPTAEIPNEEIAEMDVTELATLGPEDAKVLLIVFLDDASSKTALGYSFKIEATAILLNKRTQSILWKDKGIGTSGQGGLVGCLMAPMIKSGSTDTCVRSVLASFPKHPSKRK